MRTKDQQLLEEAYLKTLLEDEKFQPNDPEMEELSKIGLGEEFPEDEDPRNLEDYKTFLSNESEKLNSIIQNFLNDYAKKSLEKSSVLNHFEKTQGLSSSDQDQKYQILQKLLNDIQKQSNIQIDSSYIDNISRSNSEM